MTFSPQLMRAVETLQYRVTVGEVATQSGLDLHLAQTGLYNLAADAGGHLQVAETGDIVFEFPQNFRAILRNKYFKIRLKEWLDKVWHVVFFIIRISFGIALILSIVLMTIAILVLVIAISSQDNDNNSRRRSSFNMPWLIWWGPDLFNVFSPNYYRRGYGRSPQITVHKSHGDDAKEMNFLESVFSFIFGDGNPNSNLEERRWQTIGQVIQNHDGAVIAEQLAPYFDELSSTELEEETHMLAVLGKFNGYPEVSPDGELVYYFPELQIKAQERRKTMVPQILEEERWTFTLAPTGQKFLAIGLGGVNLVLGLVLGSLLQDPKMVAELGGFIGFVSAIYPVLMGYAIAFLGIPVVRYLWLQNRNSKIETRNLQRQTRAAVLTEGYPAIQKKLKFAQQFATQKVITEKDISYGTNQDLLDQQLQGRDDEAKDWERRLKEGQ